METEAQALAQLGEAISYINTQRASPAPFDLVCTGFTYPDKPGLAAETVQQRAARGMTWWLESITPFRFGLGFKDAWPVEAMRERILQRPPGGG